MQVLGEWLDLAEVAAEQPVVDRAVEEVRSVPRDHALDVLRVRDEQVELETRVPLAQLLDELEGLLREPARVDAEEADLGIDLVGHVEQGHAVVLERRRDGDARREALHRPLEHGLRLLALERNRELAGLELVDELDAQAATSSRSRCFAGSTPANWPSSSSLARRQKSVNDSSSTRWSSQPWTRPSTAWSSSSVRMRRKSGRPIAAPGPRAPRRKLSYACLRAPCSSRAVVPWKPRSATQCWPHECGQPSSCRRSGAMSVPKRSSRRSISSPSRDFVSVTEKLQCGSPVQAIEAARTWFTSSEKPISSSSVNAASTSASGTFARMKFCWRVMRTSPPRRSARSATAII